MLSKRLPAEWEPQSAILLTWPHALGDWGNDYQRVEQAFIDITKAVTQHQTVIIGAYDVAHQNDISNKLKAQNIDKHVEFYLVPSNDVWARDHGPITVYEGLETIQCDFKFNAWGAKYASQLDDLIPAALFQAGLLNGYTYRKIDFILEGGSIETDGCGTLLTTTQCLRHQQRNSQLSQAQIEQKLADYLGVNHILWLEHGHIIGDDTDGHIDTLARFLNPQTIAYVQCQNQQDPHFTALAAMEVCLRQFRTPTGHPYDLIPLPLPDPIYDREGKRLPATYANFLITNEKVLVPIYQDRQDNAVLAIFRQHFPEREIIGIDCRAVIEQFGSLHCLTMQIPQERQL